MFLPSSSWSKLQGKKTLINCFFLVLLDVFILGFLHEGEQHKLSTHRASSEGGFFTQLLFFPPLIRQTSFPGFGSDPMSSPLSIQAAPLVISAGIISSWE